MTKEMSERTKIGPIYYDSAKDVLSQADFHFALHQLTKTKSVDKINCNV